MRKGKQVVVAATAAGVASVRKAFFALILELIQREQKRICLVQQEVGAEIE